MDKKNLLVTSLIAISLIVIALLIIHFFPGILNYLPGCELFYPLDPNAMFTEGLTIETDKAYNLFFISQNDFFVKEKLDLIENFLINKTYAIGEVTTTRYLERNPELSYGIFVPHYYKVLPAVEYIIGEREDEGINMYAFVDPDQKRVTYIGYTVRPGIVSGNYTYATDTRGVLIRETNRSDEWPVENLMNVTIVDTGYNPSANMTDEQMQEFVAIALNDSHVQRYMDGYEYNKEYFTEIKGGSYCWKYGASHDYIVYYPVVDFLRLEANQARAVFIRAYIDPRYDIVGDVQPPSGLVKYTV